MFSPEQYLHSRLRRISSYLPKIKVKETKLLKDQRPKSAPLLQGDDTQTHRKNVLDQPSRAPPPAPTTHISECMSTTESSRPHNDPKRPLLSHNHAPPSRSPPVSRKDSPPLPPEDDTPKPERDSMASTNQLSKSPPRIESPRTRSPPSRTGSASPLSMNPRRVRANSLRPQSQVEVSSPRTVSTPLLPRPSSTVEGDERTRFQKHAPRKSSVFMSGRFTAKKTSVDLDDLRPWILNGGKPVPYAGMEYLMNGEKIPELWEMGDLADLYVYLYPRESGRGPQIKCPSIVIQSSPILQELAQDGMNGRNSMRSFDRGSVSIEDATRNMAIRNTVSPPYTPRLSGQEPQSATSERSDVSIRSFGSSVYGPRELHLYLPLGLMSEVPLSPGRMPDEDGSEREARDQAIIDARNLFAFLNGQAIVFTKRVPTAFRAFLNIAELLKKLGFNDDRGNTYGMAVNAAFDFFLTNDHRFADVRESREKTLEGLIMGEAMRSEALYSEAFAHAVGKYDILATSKTLLWNELSPKTKKWIERGHLQLKGYKSYVDERLTDFDFPSVFAGIAASGSSEEAKVLRFKYWKANFLSLRKAIMSYYKHLHGAWPPKANSKKNMFVEGGLNRLVLKGLYKDLSCLYDFLVDRENVTTRAAVNEHEHEPESQGNGPSAIGTMRKVLNEFDMTTTWTTPPMPLDAPRLPSLAAVEPRFSSMSAADQFKMACKRKLKGDETQKVLDEAHNVEDEQARFKTAFMHMYRMFEAKEAKHKTIRELEEQRIGHWIFLYTVLQILPLVISDAPRLHYAQGVEYFLSGTPPETMPWIENGRSLNHFYRTADGVLTQLPAHQVEFGINSIYSRSHCWQMAQKWIHHMLPEPESPIEEPGQEMPLSPLQPPPGFDGRFSRPASRGRDAQRPSTADGPPRAHSSFTTTSGMLSPLEGGPRPRPRPRSRNASQSRMSQRKSIALGLEMLPRFDGWDAPAMPAISANASIMTRTTPEPANDVTFDKIFANMGGEGDKAKEKEKEKEKKPKKKGLW